MCRSIRTLRQGDRAASEAEVRAAALQFVRKISGFRQPSAAQAGAFEGAVDEIADSSQRLLRSVTEKLGSRAGQRAG